MILMRSFRTRILALVLGLVTVVLAATVIAVVAKARSEVGRELSQQLRTAAETAREALRFRGDQLTSAAEVLTSDYGFKEAIAAGDVPTLLSAINNHRARIGADILIVLDPDGRTVASSLQGLSVNARADLQALVSADLDGQLLRLYRLIDGRPYQMVLAPVLAPDVIAWTAMGFALDDKVAADLAGVLGVEVSFVAGTGERPVIASSLAPVLRPALAGALGRDPGKPFTLNAGTEEYLTSSNPIRSANGSLTLVLQRSVAGALRPYQQLRDAIIAIGLVILALASGLAVLLARSATRPVDELTRAAERLEAGDYDAELPRAATAELSRLASAFNAMRRAVGERERTILHQASHDALTGLPNRSRMTDVLDELLLSAKRGGRALSVCLIEVQQLQNVVGSFGPAAADELLCEVARRLTRIDLMDGRVARIGTDQFLAVLDGIDARLASRRAEALAERLREPFDYETVSLQLETRIGVGVYPDDASQAAELLHCADLALLRAKESGDAVGSFVRGDDERYRHRLAVLGDLQRAIVADQLELYYQPKVTLPAGIPVGCEALLRWRHPRRGFIPPGDFIPDAERTGLIRAVTSWVLATALRQLRSWEAAGIRLDVAVNVSPADLADPGFADAVAVLLAQTGADATRLVLEVTETAAMKDLPKTLRVMEQLRILGIRFSIDDFGTGYSSLAHLKRLPVDEIKIDRSFVQELEAREADDVIVRSTINLGHSLNLKVVAEGVEVPYSWDLLERLGCDLVQGYFVAKPMPAADFTRWVSARVAKAPQVTGARRGDVSEMSACAIDVCPVGEALPPGFAARALGARRGSRG
jgi:diguanylate cyclase (GGDEF)-like protein